MLLAGRLTQCFWVGEIKQNHDKHSVRIYIGGKGCAVQPINVPVPRWWDNRAIIGQSRSRHLGNSWYSLCETLFWLKCSFFLEFYRWLNDFEPFYVQYDSRVNILVRNRTGSESNENECGFCKELYHEGKTWLQCPSCRIWFHKECFGK